MQEGDLCYCFFNVQRCVSTRLPVQVFLYERVSPPEKQLACQRARLCLNTHSNTLRSCTGFDAKTFGSKLWLDATRRVKKKKKRERGLHSACDVHSRAAARGLQG